MPLVQMLKVHLTKKMITLLGLSFFVFDKEMLDEVSFSQIDIVLVLKNNCPYFEIIACFTIFRRNPLLLLKPKSRAFLFETIVIFFHR
jgi:hypothetical protein